MPRSLFREAEIERLEDRANLRPIHRAAQLASEPLDRQLDRRRLFQISLAVRETTHYANPRRNLLQQLTRARQSANRVRRVLGFLEAHGGVGAKFQSDRSLSHTYSLEARAFEHDASGAGINRAIEAPDDARDGDGACGVGDHKVRRAELITLLIQ